MQAEAVVWKFICRLGIIIYVETEIRVFKARGVRQLCFWSSVRSNPSATCANAANSIRQFLGIFNRDMIFLENIFPLYNDNSSVFYFCCYFFCIYQTYYAFEVLASYRLLAFANRSNKPKCTYYIESWKYFPLLHDNTTYFLPEHCSLPALHSSSQSLKIRPALWP